jgi:hypothetical protein
MREIRTSGSEGGAGRKPRSYLYLAPRRRRSISKSGHELMGDSVGFSKIDNRDLSRLRVGDDENSSFFIHQQIRG